jgi:hypothetical protein
LRFLPLLSFSFFENGATFFFRFFVHPQTSEKSAGITTLIPAHPFLLKSFYHPRDWGWDTRQQEGEPRATGAARPHTRGDRDIPGLSHFLFGIKSKNPKVSRGYRQQAQAVALRPQTSSLRASAAHARAAEMSAKKLAFPHLGFVGGLLYAIRKAGKVAPVEPPEYLKCPITQVGKFVVVSSCRGVWALF